MRLFAARCMPLFVLSAVILGAGRTAAHAGTANPVPVKNSANEIEGIAAQADLSITKTNGVTTVAAGSSFFYTITASNAGPSNVPAATVTDTFPGFPMTCGTWSCAGAGGGTCTSSGSGSINDLAVFLPAGGSVSYNVFCTTSAAAPSGSLVNTATVSSPIADPNSANNSATDTDAFEVTADLSIIKTDGVTTATAGGSTTYSISVSNGGPSNITNALVTDILPGSLTCTWTCLTTLGSSCSFSGSGNINDFVTLLTGDSVFYNVTCAISASAMGPLVNTAIVTPPSGTIDPDLTDNSATDTDTLGADLSITKTDGATDAGAGGPVNYTIVASNAGPSGVAGATITDTFPALLTCAWSCVGLGGGTCTGAGTGSIGDTVDLPMGGTANYTANCTLSASAIGTLTNTATVTAPSGTADPNPTNNSATDIDTIIAAGATFFTLTPCRLLDTRELAGPFGGPPLAPGVGRSFDLAGRCGIPADAHSVSLNLTVVGANAPGVLRAYTLEDGVPVGSVLSFATGQTRANNAVVKLSTDGAGRTTFRAEGGSVHVVADVNGYFR